MTKGKGELTDKAHECIRKGQWEKALGFLEQARSMDGEDPMLSLWMGDLSMKLGEPRKAAENYLRTAARFAKQGHTHKAIATYKMVLRIDPSDKTASRYIQDAAKEQVGPHAAARPGPAPRQAAPPSPPPEILGGCIEMPAPAGQEFPPAPEPEPRPGEIPLLFDLSAEELHYLFTKMRPRTYAAGAVIVREGDQGSSMYIIRHGSVRVVTRVGDKEVVLARLGERDFFGEMSFLTHRPRTADIVAETPSEIWEVTAADLDEVVKRHPKVQAVLRLFHESRISDIVSSLKAVTKEFFG